MPHEVEWTPELRQRIYPSRRHPNPAIHVLLEEKEIPYPIDADLACTELARHWRSSMHPGWLTRGLERNPPSWRPVVERIVTRIANPDLGEPLDSELEAAAVAFGLCPVSVAVPYWISAASLPFALRTLLRYYEIQQAVSIEEGAFIVDAPRPFDYVDDDTGEWTLLRALLAEAIAPVYDEAHAIADRARLAVADAEPSPLHLLLPFAFPDETAWAKAAAPAAIALAKRGKRGFCYELARYVSVAPVEAGVQVLSSMWNNNLEASDLVTAVAHHGPVAGVRLLEAAIGMAPSGADRTELGEVLLAIRSPDAAKAFARLAKHPKAKGALAPLAKQHRERMKPAKPRTKPSTKKRAKPKAR